MKKVKVLHITSTRYGIGGVEKLLLDMSARHDTERFEISYCNLFCDAGGDGAFPKELRARGLNVIEIPGNRWVDVPKMAFRLAKVIRSERFDLIHLHMLQATIVGGFAAMLSRGVKRVVTKHYTRNLSNHPAAIKKLDNFFTKTSDKVYAISEYVKADMVADSIPAEKIVVIYNGTDISAFDKLAEENSTVLDRISDGEFLIGTAGSLTERKGQKYLLEAIPIVAATHPNVRLLVIGEGPERERLNSVLKEIDIGDRIEMLGFQKNVASLLKSLDLYVHPSINEPFGIAILEAMAAGKCVVATNVDGVPEIVRNGETGLLVDPSDPAELAKAIIHFIENPVQLDQFGKEGRKTVENRFEIGITVRQYEKNWLKVVEK